MTTQLTFNLQPTRRALTVSELTSRIRDLFTKNFTDLSVEGEISNCREAQSGHLYFTLKDERAQIRCVWFKQDRRGLKFRVEDGLKVTLRGSISVYEQRGEYQIYVESMEPAGLGALQLAFEQLKKRLEAEGLFDPARKNFSIKENWWTFSFSRAAAAPLRISGRSTKKSSRGPSSIRKFPSSPASATKPTSLSPISSRTCAPPLPPPPPS